MRAFTSNKKRGLYASHKTKGLASAEAREVYVEEIRRVYGDSEFLIREYREKFGLSKTAANTRIGSLVAFGDLFWRPVSLARRGERGVANARLYSLRERPFERVGETEEKRYARLLAACAVAFETRPFAIKDALKVERARREPLTRYLKPFRVGWGRYQFPERFVVESYEALDHKDSDAAAGVRLFGADFERYERVKKRRDWLRDDPLGRAVYAYRLLRSSARRDWLLAIERELRESDKTIKTLSKRTKRTKQEIGVEIEKLVDLDLVGLEYEQETEARSIGFYWWKRPEITLKNVFERIDSDPFFYYWNKDKSWRKDDGEEAPLEQDGNFRRPL